MKYYWLVIVTLVVCNLVQTDTESCQRIINQDLEIGSSDSEKTIIVQVVENLDLELTVKQTGQGDFVPKATVIEKSGRRTHYDGFICFDDPVKNLSISPCEQYLNLVDQLNVKSPEFVRCFVLRESGTEKLKSLIVLNRKSHESVYSKVIDSDSFTFSIQFINAMIKSMVRNAYYLMPVLSLGNNHFHWMNGHNMIIQHESDQLELRPRFINTKVSGRLEENQVNRAIKQLFYFIKRWVHQRKSCQKIMVESKNSQAEELGLGASSFLNNHLELIKKLKSIEDPTTSVPLSLQQKYKLILETAALSYCLKKTEYSWNTLYKLQKVLSFIDGPDKAFPDEEAKKAFEITFAVSDSEVDPKVNKLTEVNSVSEEKVWPSVRSKKVQKIYDTILDEPIFPDKNLKPKYSLNQKHKKPERMLEISKRFFDFGLV